jgi:acetyl esterase/lipase
MKGMLEEVASLEPSEGKVLKDLVYKRRLLRKDLTLDIYFPLTSAGDGGIGTVSAAEREAVPDAGYATLVYIHGGSWLHGDKSTIRIVDPFLKDLRRNGIAVVAIAYTAGPAGGLKAPVENCRDALLWLRDSGINYGLDPENMGLYGVSAGAHLAMMVIPFIQKEEGFGLRFLLEEIGPVDLQAMASGDAFGASVLFRLFPSETLEDYSPLNHVNALWPPVLMFHGTADRTVSIRQSEELDRRLTEAGVPHRFHIVPEGDHGFFNKSREEWRVLEQECLQFLLPLISPEA